eukprot:m.16258 g.16258  ORF g.16258 m.16258 type:complete len:172 (+) comp5642_c0_seq2:237-752(+)
MSSARVEVWVYDLSHGMMSAMSQQFLGKQLDGLWHTSVVAFGKEYFYGGGIQKATPGSTQAGQPKEKVHVGNTEVPEWLFEQFLEGLMERFSPQNYHLLSNNCNHFSDEAAGFLTGKGAPDYVRNLPAEFASSPLGAMMTPMIDSFFKSMGGSAAPVGAQNNFGAQNNYGR